MSCVSYVPNSAADMSIPALSRIQQTIFGICIYLLISTFVFPQRASDTVRAILTTTMTSTTLSNSTRQSRPWDILSYDRIPLAPSPMHRFVCIPLSQTIFVQCHSTLRSTLDLMDELTTLISGDINGLITEPPRPVLYGSVEAAALKQTSATIWQKLAKVEACINTMSVRA